MSIRFTRSTLFACRLTQPCSGPMPFSSFARRRLPLSSSSSSIANSWKRPFSSDFSFSVALAKEDDAQTTQSFFEAASAANLLKTSICTSLYFFSCGHFSDVLLSKKEMICSMDFFFSFARSSSMACFRFSRAWSILPVATSSRCHFTTHSTVEVTPSSCCIFALSAITLSFMGWLPMHTLILAASSSESSFERRQVPWPQPSAVMCFAMSCWSAKTGVTTVGVPAPSEACVVPMPP
mmetsp:Transcript_22552/g.57492  ORF Transcript_22552/g.57492 Transcript_22552/m.57492 type:complete len:237 (+) Transcript_22552:368-1078(+)